MMSLKHLTLESIGDLANGAAGPVIEHELAVVKADLSERGMDGLKRTLTIVLTFQQSGEDVAVDVAAKAKTPPLSTAPTAAMLRTKAGETDLLFQGLNCENPHQDTFEELEDGEIREEEQ